METAAVVFFALGALASTLTAILLWRRMRNDPQSRVLMWAVLLFPCAGGLAGCLGALLSLLGGSRTPEVLVTTFAILTVAAIAAHLCLQIVYFLGLLRRRSERGDQVGRRGF